MTPQSRAHRILRPIARYRDLGVAGDEASRLPVPAPHEVWIGFYDNPPEGSRDIVAFSTERVYIRDGWEWRSVRYADIETSAIVGEKHRAEAVLVTTATSACIVPIRGGDGRLRDAWSVLRFLDRVSEDARRRDAEAAPRLDIAAAR